MAKIQQKSEKITAFGGIFFVLDKFDSILSSVIDSHLPNRLPNQWITNRQVAPDKLYPHLCYIAYWLNSINPANTFTKDIKALLTQYPVVNPAAMGFPCEIRTPV